ncbi:MAG: DUF2442 domain-containing protein [Verrucomicrobia bacterium]|nr:DUF2442 domain-containing protein [Verrucomicrobiota bacterium]
MKSSIVELEAKAMRVWIERRNVCLALADEREIRFPAAKNRRLRKATPQQLANVELICDGTGLHWPDVDEDLSVQGILEGRLGQP